MAKCLVNIIKDACLKKTSNYHHGNLKEELLKKAIEIIQTQGVDAVTLQILATQLGTSRSAIYRHFSSKNELMQNVILYAFDIFDEVISPIFMQKDKSVIERLHKMGKAYIKFAVENPNLFRMLFGEKFQTVREENCDTENEEEAKAFHSLVGLLVEGQETNQFNVQDPILQALTIHAQVHGIASLYIDGHTNIKDNLEELFEVSFKIMTEGLLLK